MKFKPTGLRWSNEQWIGFHFAWDNNGEAVKEALKNFPIRAWDPVNKTWWFPESLADLMVATVRAFFPDLVIPSKPVLTRVTETRSPQANDHALLGLLPDCPDCVLHAAFKVMSRELDPNSSVGGFSRTPFEEMESAYLRICRARGLA